MYTRISRAKIKPSRRTEVEALLAKLRADSHRALPGIKYWMNFITDENELIVIGVYGTEAERAATAPVNVERWGSVMHLMAEAPTIIDGEMTEFFAV